MNKDVIVRVSGLHIAPDGGGDIPIEVIAVGEYYCKNNRHYLFYEEALEGYTDVTKNRVIFETGRLEITKKGVVSAHLLFESEKRNSTYYYTPFGSITIGIDTESMDMEISEERICVDVKYALEMNASLVSNCRIKIEIMERKGANLDLT